MTVAASGVGRRAFDGLLIAALALASFCGILRYGMQPSDPSQGVGVVFVPWTSQQAAFVRSVGAGARFVRYGGVPFAVVVIPERPDYIARIFADGALLALDPRVLAACLSVLPARARTDDQS